MAGHGIGDLCSLIFLAVIARNFGSEVLGEFWYAMAIGALLAAMVTRGTRPLILRDASQRLDMMPKFVGAAAGGQLALASVLLLIVLAASPALADTPRAQAILVIIVLYQVGYVLASVFRIGFNAHEDMHFGALLESGHKILILVVGVGAIFLFESAARVLTVYPAAAVAMYVAGYMLVSRRYGRPKIHFDWKLNLGWTIAAFPLFIHLALKVLANRSGVIILDNVADSATVGLFAAGDRLVSAFGLPFVMLTGAVFPIMSKLADKPEELRSFVGTCLRVSAVAAVPLTALVVIFREPLVVLAFGEKFLDSSTMLGILAIGIMFTALNSLLSMLLIATDDLWALLRFYAAGLAVLFIGIFVSIETTGGLGLAWSVVASKTALALGLLAYCQSRPLRVSGFRPLLAALAAAIVMVLLFNYAGTLAYGVRVAVTMLAGLIALVVCRGVEFRDLHRLKQALGI